MASILQQIGTPLQLAALFLLLMFGAARVLIRTGRWQPSAAIGRLVINRMFQAAMITLVVGIGGPAIAPALEHWLNPEQVFRGAVLSAKGEPIVNASVNLIAIGTVPTNAPGQFKITVPRDRRLKKYKIQVTATGYQFPGVQTKTDKEMTNVEVRLTPAPAELVKGLEDPVFIGHYYGNPVVMITLRVENPGTSTTPINEIRATIVGPDTSFVSQPAVWDIVNPFGPYWPVVGPFPIFAGARLDLRVVLMPGMSFSVIDRQVRALPEYASQSPCLPRPNGSADPMSAAAFKIVKDYSASHFLWKDGPWHLNLEIVSDNQAGTFRHDFVLSSAEIDRLRNSIELLRQCITSNMQAPLAQDGGNRSAVGFNGEPPRAKPASSGLQSVSRESGQRTGRPGTMIY